MKHVGIIIITFLYSFSKVSQKILNLLILRSILIIININTASDWIISIATEIVIWDVFVYETYLMKQKIFLPINLFSK